MIIITAILMMAQLAQTAHSPVVTDKGVVEKYLDKGHAQTLCDLCGSDLIQLSMGAGVSPEPFGITSRGTELFQVASIAPTSFEVFGSDGRLVMKIDIKTGHVSFGEGITPDEATKQFVSALEKMANTKLATCPPLDPSR